MIPTDYFLILDHKFFEKVVKATNNCVDKKAKLEKSKLAVEKERRSRQINKAMAYDLTYPLLHL